MEARAINIISKQDKNLKIKIIPGHFATNHSHINYYIDMTGIKTKHNIAKIAGELLAKEYETNTVIDTIVCMDGTEVIAAYLADRLAENGYGVMNRDETIRIITPEFNTNGQMIFRDNIQPMIQGKHVIVLMASVTTGITIRKSMECISYYGGMLVGISAIFSAVDEVEGQPVNAVFHKDDIPDYQSCSMHDCPLCKEGRRIDALVNSFGYSKL